MPSYLIVGNQTLDSPELAEAIRERVATEASTFHVVVPVTPISRGLTWDEDEARAAAQQRLTSTMNRLHAIGLEVTGEVGVQDPIQATRDALRDREIDEVILSTLPPGLSRWLGQDVPSKLKGSIDVPVAVVTTQHQSVSAAQS
jgi:hypothetical protein